MHKQTREACTGHWRRLWQELRLLRILPDRRGSVGGVRHLPLSLWLFSCASCAGDGKWGAGETASLGPFGAAQRWDPCQAPAARHSHAPGRPPRREQLPHVSWAIHRAPSLACWDRQSSGGNPLAASGTRTQSAAAAPTPLALFSGFGLLPGVPRRTWGRAAARSAGPRPARPSWRGQAGRCGALGRRWPLRTAARPGWGCQAPVSGPVAPVDRKGPTGGPPGRCLASAWRAARICERARGGRCAGDRTGSRQVAWARLPSRRGPARAKPTGRCGPDGGGPSRAAVRCWRHAAGRWGADRGCRGRWGPALGAPSGGTAPTGRIGAPGGGAGPERSARCPAARSRAPQGRWRDSHRAEAPPGDQRWLPRPPSWALEGRRRRKKRGSELPARANGSQSANERALPASCCLRPANIRSVTWRQLEASPPLRREIAALLYSRQRRIEAGAARPLLRSCSLTFTLPTDSPCLFAHGLSHTWAAGGSQRTQKLESKNARRGRSSYHLPIGLIRFWIGHQNYLSVALSATQIHC